MSHEDEEVGLILGNFSIILFALNVLFTGWILVLARYSDMFESFIGTMQERNGTVTLNDIKRMIAPGCRVHNDEAILYASNLNPHPIQPPPRDATNRQSLLFEYNAARKAHYQRRIAMTADAQMKDALRRRRYAIPPVNRDFS
jgi:hypothetical protein